MKKLLAVLSLAFLAGMTPVLANKIGSYTGPEEVFAQKFTGAENVKWTKIPGGYDKVSFTIAGTRAEAYFSADGELLGTARNILYSQLPLVVMQTVSNRFVNAIVVEITEITNADGTSYRVMLEQKNKKVTLRLNTLGEITGQQKEKIRK